MKKGRVGRKLGGFKRKGAPLRKKRSQRRLRGLKRKVAAKRPKVKSISKLLKEADALFSKIVRSRNVDKEGNCTCYTCGHRAPLKRVQCGHLISRWYKIVRHDFDNARVQCWVCNIYKKGDSINFRRKLIAEIGKERVEAAEEKCSQKFKLTREYLLDLIERLKV